MLITLELGSCLLHNFCSHERNFPCLFRHTQRVYPVYSINSHNRNFINLSSYKPVPPTMVW